MAMVSIKHPTGAANFSHVIVGNLDLWFSYETVIAFRVGWDEAVLSENLWGPTTGRHINAVERDVRSLPRMDRVSFDAELKDALATIGECD